MSIASTILNAYRNIFGEKMRNFNEVGNAMHKIPHFTEENVIALCNHTIQVLSLDQTLVEVDGDVIVVGDIHGSLDDLLRILHTYGLPPLQQYIFLGDYVDRGEYSCEVVVLLFALKCVFPKHIILLRGNHEFKQTNSMYGFLDECLALYSQKTFDLFNTAFDYLPLAAITIRDRSLLLHGGISKYLVSIEQIGAIIRPSEEFENTPYRQLVKDIVWSDPAEEGEGWMPSMRGDGSLFGMNELKSFLLKNNLSQLIRGHQCIANGAGRFNDNNLYTVFSSSNYSPGLSNLSGILRISNGFTECMRLPALSHIKREDASFQDIDANNYKSSMYHSLTNSFTNYRPVNKSRYSFVRRSTVNATHKNFIPKDANKRFSNMN